jgi:hypothetical protein
VLGTVIAFALAVAAAPPPAAEAPATATTEPSEATTGAPRIRSRTQPRWMSDRTYEYLTRDLVPNPRFLDHGVIEASAAGGWPHRYRVGAAIGLYDHLTLGVTAHYFRGRAQVTPRVAIAFWRWRVFSVGALHFWTMYPPPERDLDPTTPSFRQSAQWVLGTATFGQRWVSAGVDAGAVRARRIDPSVEPELDNQSIVRWRFGGGLHLRAGTRRWGFTAQAHLPHLTAEVVFDVRFGAFELRPRGGWRTPEYLRANDRRVPTRD